MYLFRNLVKILLYFLKTALPISVVSMHSPRISANPSIFFSLFAVKYFTYLIICKLLWLTQISWFLQLDFNQWPNSFQLLSVWLSFWWQKKKKNRRSFALWILRFGVSSGQNSASHCAEVLCWQKRGLNDFQSPFSLDCSVIKAVTYPDSIALVFVALFSCSFLVVSISY